MMYKWKDKNKQYTNRGPSALPMWSLFGPEALVARSNISMRSEFATLKHEYKSETINCSIPHIASAKW